MIITDNPFIRVICFPFTKIYFIKKYYYIAHEE